MAFGLVNVPIKMYAATEDHDVRFHQVHAQDGGRIRMKRVCEVCGKELSYSEISKGYEDSSGRRLIMDPDDLEALPMVTGRDIDVVEFVPAEQIDPILFDRTYYLEPDSRAVKPYVLLREALDETDRIAVVKIAVRSKTQLACLRVHDGVIVLQTMIWPDEVRKPSFEFLDADTEIRPAELAMAQSLIETMAGDFDPGEFHDEYREALLNLIESRLAGGKGIELPAASESADAGQVVDLMAALRESVARSQAKRGGGDAEGVEYEAAADEEAAPAPRKTTSKRAAAKRSAPVRKTNAKATAKTPAKATARTAKATAKKTTAKKTTTTKRTAGRKSA